MIGIVLVGGEGTRLRPLTTTIPKQLLPVNGTAMIERVVGHLADHGVERVVLSMGYQPDAFLARYPDSSCAGVSLTYAIEDTPLDTAGAVRFAAEHGKLTDTFLVANGDVLTDLDVSALVAFHRDRRADATIALTPVEDPSTFGVVPTGADGRVTAFIEKPPPGEAPTNLINAGYYVLEPVILERIAPGRRVSIERETFPALVADRSLYAFGSDAYWIDAGTPATYLRANLHALGEGGVTSVIGSGCHIDASATIESSVLLDGVTIEAGAVVRQSIVGPDARVGRNASITDLTVVGAGAMVPNGAQLAGARVQA